MAQKRLDEQFGFTIKTPIYDNLNRVLSAVEMRLIPLEVQRSSLDELMDDITNVALQRMNEIFTPLVIDAKERMEEFGANFSAHSTTSLTVGLGGQVVQLDTADRAGFVFSDYAAVRRTDGTEWMTGVVDSYNRPTGQLFITVVDTFGSGTFNSWDIRIGTPPDLAHAGRTDNPHDTTAIQVGAYSIAEADARIDETDALQTAAITSAYNSAIANAVANARPFPIGTKMLFLSTIPSGWVIDSSINDYALRIASANPGLPSSSGGAFSTIFSYRTSDAHALTGAETGPHSHFLNGGGYYYLIGDGSYEFGNPPTYSGYFGSGVSYIYNYTQTAGGGVGHTHTYDLTVRYVNAVIGIKQ